MASIHTCLPLLYSYVDEPGLRARSVVGAPRMTDWREWRDHVYPLLDRD